jgi:DNA-binding MarR family transcriptional regulator
MDKYINNQDKRLSRYTAEEIVGLVQREVAEVLTFAATLSRRTGLGHSEMAAMERLQHAYESETGGLTPTQLGRYLSLSSGAVTALIDRLERAGHVERRPNPRDRRSSVVRPRPSEGLEEARKHLLPVVEEMLEAASGLTDEERAAVGWYLKIVAEIFARHAREE